MKSFIALSMLLLATMIVCVHGGLPDLWKKFKTKHGRRYNSTEDSFRLSIFRKKDTMIQSHNSRKQRTFTMAHNMFSDMTLKEMKKYLGYKPKNKMRSNKKKPAFKLPTLGKSSNKKKLLVRPKQSAARKQKKRIPRWASIPQERFYSYQNDSIFMELDDGEMTMDRILHKHNNKPKKGVLTNFLQNLFGNNGGTGPVSPTGGKDSSDPKVTPTNATSDEKSYSTDYNDAFDLRNVNPKCIGPAKDQKACGSCWAFSAIASIEYVQCLKNAGRYVQLSVQQLLDCTGQIDGCAGGSPEMGFDYLLTTTSLTESSYPYWFLAANYGFAPLPFCWDWLNKAKPNAFGAQLVSYKYVGGGEESIKSAVQEGVVSNCVYVPDSGTLQAYSSGVYSDPTCGKNPSNHCTAIVGYGVDQATNRKYWIVLNQWGTSWGMNGYVLWERGTNMCQIEKDSAIFLVTVAGN